MSTTDLLNNAGGTKPCPRTVESIDEHTMMSSDAPEPAGTIDNPLAQLEAIAQLISRPLPGCVRLPDGRDVLVSRMGMEMLLRMADHQNPLRAQWDPLLERGEHIKAAEGGRPCSA